MGVNNSLTEETKSKIYDDFINELKIKEIKSKFGIGGHTLRAVLSEKGIINYRTRETYSQTLKSLDITLLQDLVNQGLNVTKIAKHLGVNNYIVRRTLAEHNITKVEVDNFYTKSNLNEHITYDEYTALDREKVIRLRRIFKKNPTLSKQFTFTFYDFLNKFYNDKQFNHVYELWLKTNKSEEAYPSLDHITPLSKGGTNDLDNLQIITWLENRAKNNLPQDEWEHIKKHINDYFI